jgi:hypothetical protein
VNRRGARGIALLVIGLVFMAVGISGQRAFIAIGIAFAVIGLSSLIRQGQGAGLVRVIRREPRCDGVASALRSAARQWAFSRSTTPHECFAGSPG